LLAEGSDEAANKVEQEISVSQDCIGVVGSANGTGATESGDEPVLIKTKLHHTPER
jgi:hypothetical protein